MYQKALFIVLLSCSVLACTPASQQLMSSVQYEQAIPFKSKKVAHLKWQEGNVLSGHEYTQPNPNGGLIGNLTVAMINSAMDKRNPDRHTYKFDRAHQAVFMTSLRDVLLTNDVFKDVQIDNGMAAPTNDNVDILVKFKHTKVGRQEDSFPITLSVDVVIDEANKATFKRGYLVKTDRPSGFFHTATFKKQQENVSKKLMEKMIVAISDWNETNTG